MFGRMKCQCRRSSASTEIRLLQDARDFEALRSSGSAFHMAVRTRARRATIGAATAAHMQGGGEAEAGAGGLDRRRILLTGTPGRGRMLAG